MALIIWGTAQTLRLEASRNETQKTILEHEQYNVNQQAEVQREQQKTLERFTAALTNKETENETHQE